MSNLNRDDCEKLADFLIDITQHTEIYKHEPGKIVLKFSLSAYRLAMDGVDGLDVSRALECFRGIKSHDFSLFWRTLEIVYDTSIIDETLWKDLISPNGDLEHKRRVRQSLMSILINNPV